MVAALARTVRQKRPGFKGAQRRCRRRPVVLGSAPASQRTRGPAEGTMGGAGLGDLGLWIKTVDVKWHPPTRDLVRISEVGVITKFGEVTVPASLSYRPKGLQIGMQFRISHQVGATGT